ncbi:MAG: zf-HC2 domain-containing protein [Elusimicrobiales bacterium]
MNCEYGEKLILYAYGEAGPELAAGVEAHLPGCASCRAELAALRAADSTLASAPAEPSRNTILTIMRAARAVAEGRRGFRFSWGEALLSGALASAMAFVFAFSGRTASPDLAWNSGLDARLDSVEYSVYQAQSDALSAQRDWEYRLSDLEDESLDLSKNV